MSAEPITNPLRPGQGPAPLRSGPLVPVVAFLLAALCVTTVALTATVRGTAASPGFYQAVLDEESAYDRLYSEVLVDPELSPLTRDLLARLPVPEALVTSNIKVVLPPDTVRALTDQQIHAVTGYLRGEDDELRLRVDITPVLENLGDLARIYFGDLVASLQGRDQPDFDRFTADLNSALDELKEGRAPALPALPLTDEQADRAADALLAAAPGQERAALRPEVEVALAEGDVATALAATVAAVLSDSSRNAAAGLRTTLQGGTWDLTGTLTAAGNDLTALEQTRDGIRFLPLLQILAATLALAALATLWSTGPAAPARRVMRLGQALACGGALTAATVLLARLITGGRFFTTPSSWAPSVTGLVDDLQRTAVDQVVATGLGAALVALVGGVLLTGAGGALLVHPGRLLPPTPAVLRGTAAGVACAALAGVLIVPPVFGPSAPRRCQGSSRLCELRYDEVAHLTSHNAMSTTADRFIGPLQDPDITTQLSTGVRALQLDTYRWESPQDITARLDTPEFTPEQRRLISGAVDRANPPREGLWLCHSVCRAGAVELVPALTDIGDWLRAHPAEIVTLIIQDDISAEDTERAFRAAGLDDLLHTPAENPDEPWPTLAEMIDSGRRLVVFAEKADGPAPWYRNFYRYGMETPFAFRSPSDMTCEPNRGGTGKRLFLLNHFITDGGGSRLDAGQVNTREWVLERARACEAERGRPVTFIAVDYTTIGDALGAVNELNSRRAQK
ncbi:PI-PLC domain-containing protein [Streptomyces sp. C11-1]|uniref:PI-PLC domain-containing protein n=1 Tax=Streptomyces durocortorensis TaxID=2811104 RepID=A0ABY9W474_9ACTN|nr:PI-PLC domain-containing protein [Streptomyces durocortorensis]WNF30828.1 PI-PLC domain-containing protein [Streptomyces durocortorensis]